MKKIIVIAFLIIGISIFSTEKAYAVDCNVNGEQFCSGRQVGDSCQTNFRCAPYDYNVNAVNNSTYCICTNNSAIDAAQYNAWLSANSSSTGGGGGSSSGPANPPATTTGEDKELNVGDINIEDINIPLFLPFDLEFVRAATVFSWISFAGILATSALIVFWVYLILRAAVKAMQSRGESEGLQEASKKFKSIFVGMFLTFLVPIVLTVIGVLLGIGSIFQWPKMFSACDIGTYHYYYQVYLDQAGSQEAADAICAPQG